MSKEDERYPDDSDEKLDLEVISDFARSYLLGIITDDNPSPGNGLTALEQVIAYVFDLSSNNQEEINRIKSRVYAKIYDLNGGCDMSDGDFLSLEN